MAFTLYPKFSIVYYSLIYSYVISVLSYSYLYMLDKDSNGEISWSEFVAFQLRSREILGDSWPLDLNDLRGEFSDLDTNGDGKKNRKN